MAHVVWDWNGTLFDDLHVIVEAVNVSLAELGAPPIDHHGYRDHYTRPVSVFYERLLGRPVSDDEWLAIDTTFHDVYRDRLGRARLAEGATEALEAIKASGASQSLLSMWWHDELVPFVSRFQVAGYMTRIDGNRRGAGDTKAGHLRHHLETLDLDAGAVVMIGDALDDADAAAAVGTACVLYDGGAHHRVELEAAGVPVAASLPEAVALAKLDG